MKAWLFGGGPSLRVFLLLAAAIGVVYANALGNGFILQDDSSQIIQNQKIRSLSGVMSYFARATRAGHIEDTTTYFYRPIFWLSLGADHALWGLNPFGYHLTNILIHLFNAFLGYLLIRLVTGDTTIAAVTALLWAVHPVQTEVVTWAASRARSLCALFYLSALLLLFMSCRLRGWKRIGLSSGALGSFVLALLSYEMAVTLPIIAVLLDYWRVDSEANGGKAMLRHHWRLHLLLGTVLAGYLLVRFAVLVPSDASTGPHGFAPGISLRLLQIPSILVTYLRLLIFPLHLSLDHSTSIPQPSSPFDIQVVAPGLLLACLVLLSFRVRRRVPGLLTGLGWFFIILAPVSNLLPIYRIIGEAWLYLPSLGFFMAVASGGLALIRWLEASMPHYRWRGYGLAALGVTVTLFGSRVILRNRDYKDALTLHRAEAAASPNSYLAQYYLGLTYYHHRQLALAEAAFLKAGRLRPNQARASLGLGLVYLAQDRPDLAIAEFQKAVALQPDKYETRIFLGTAYEEHGQRELAIAEFQKAVTLEPANFLAHYRLGMAYRGQRRLAEAASELRQALAIEPQNKSARLQLNSVEEGLRRGR